MPARSATSDPPRPGLAHALAPLGALAAMAVFAAGESAPAAAAETGFLALLSAGVLAAVAALGGAGELWVGAPLTVLAAWALPAGPARGAVTTALLVALFAIAAARRLTGARAGTTAEAFALFAPLAVGAQLLLRGDRLATAAAWSPEVVGGLIVLPAAAAGALALLVRRHGLARTLTAGAAVAVLAPGFNVAAALALVAVAAGASLVAPLADPAGSSRSLLERAGGALAVAAVAAAVFWEPRTAAVAAVAAAIATGLPAAALLGVAAAVALALAAPLAGWATVAAALAWVPIVLPALPWALLAPFVVRKAEARAVPAPADAPPGGGWGVAAALALAVAAARVVPDPAALAAPLALLALSMPRPRPLRAPQALWSAALPLGTALLASYPWLRPRAAAAALALTGLAPGWTAAGVLAAAVGLAAAAGAAATRQRTPAAAALARPAVWAGALLAGALLLAAPAPGRSLARSQTAVLDRAHPRLAVDLAGGAVAAVVVDSNLSNAAELPPGTRVATARLLGPHGGLRAAWELLAGRDTGEWAAHRPDLAGRPDLAVPPAWLSWVEPGAGRPFFGQRYRARLGGGAPVAAARLELMRDPRLPQEVTLSLFRLETVR